MPSCCSAYGAQTPLAGSQGLVSKLCTRESFGRSSSAVFFISFAHDGSSLLWLNCVPQKLIEVLMHVTLFENRSVADVISLDEVILDAGGPLLQYVFCPYKIGGFGHTHGETVA